MSDDLVERLRWGLWLDSPGGLHLQDPETGERVHAPPVIHAAADEIERLRAVMTAAVEELAAVHRPDPDLPRWCVTCSTTDGSWPCITRMVADDLTDALKGTTDDD